MESWKILFDSHILKRGKIYYKKDMVKNVKKDPDGNYFAIVTGNHDYEVKSTF